MTPMDCADIKALLSGLIDDEVDAETRHLAERHLGQCRPCRRLLDDAERLDATMAQDFEHAVAEDALPAGFEAAVMARIADDANTEIDAHDDIPPTYRVRRWSWPGAWAVAASAAALGLSLVVWMRGTAPSTPTSTENTAIAGRLDALSDDMRFMHDRVSQMTAALESRDASSDDDMNSVMVAHDAPVRTVEPGLAMVSVDRVGVDPVYPLGAPLAPERLESAQLIEDRAATNAFVPVTDIDADALYAASVALAQLEHASEESFADVHYVRSFVEYDELMVRLKSVRLLAAPAERPVLFAVESVLDSVVSGPLDMHDVRELKRLVEMMELVSRVEAMARRYDALNML